ncbi:unnamed protein product [Chrysodeixis includens]|uniref:Peptidase S1 domain-containing protein n=1 Tax=Chrysodeixis includens TaxID=689277 RepID=A0A9P0BMG0_CHRIL|nr:unnamed protein product [Chrysodeixis includens]
MRVIAFLALCLVAVAAVPSSRSLDRRLVTIEQYPSTALILMTWDGIHMRFHCGGTIINNRAILTAGHCMYYRPSQEFRVRIGSSFANTGGQVIPVGAIALYPGFNDAFFHWDISIVLTPGFTYSNTVRPAPIAGFNLADNLTVLATGWADIEGDRQINEEQLVTVSQDACIDYYDDAHAQIKDDVVCTKRPDQDGGYCGGFGAGIFQSGILVAVHSNCYAPLPSLAIRVSHHTAWIQANA